MRIAYLTQSYPPMVSGVAVVVQRLAECMTARGHTVLVIAASDRGDSYLTFKNNFLLLRLRSAVNNFRAQQRFLVYPRNSLLKALQDFEPDIIHTHDVFQIGRLGAEFAQSMSIPIVGTLHGLPSFILSYLPNIPGLRSGAEAALWEYGRWSVRRYAAITTPTETISNLVRVMTKVLPHTISNGVDLDAFKPRPFSRDEELRLRERVGIPPDVPIILHVGRLDVDKRVEHVVIAVARAMLSNQAHLLIVGDGNEKPTLIKLSESLGIRERCHFPGFISVDDGLPDIYRIASLL
ncbi:MAG TPA: glycosyltransferase, partial [Anaerolineales bacterium]|nr:glycosyltransferase [Anaerolineales bacterium]